MAKLEDRRFDIRTLERNISAGLITKEEYEKYLAELEDAQENAAPMDAKFEVGVLDADEKDD
jgi:hypothetical protein